MNYEDQEFCKADNPKTWLAIENKKEPEPVKCPDCKEIDEYYPVHGVCTCTVQTLWEQDHTTLSFNSYLKLYFLIK